MTTIRQDDFVQSIADALQFISYYHPLDYIQALGRAYEREQSPAAKDAMAQILVNSRMCAEGHRPICQDTGAVVVFLKVGMEVRWDAKLSVEQMVNEGVRRAYTHPDNVLRASMVADPLGTRKNTRDNTPAIIHTELVPGGRVEVKLAAKGGGSENKSRFTILNPSDSLVDWVLRTVPTLGAGWCPPGMLGIGVGGTAEKAMLLAKEALMEPIDIDELIARGPSNRLEELRLELFTGPAGERGLHLRPLMAVQQGDVRGVGLEEITREAVMFHEQAYKPEVAPEPFRFENGGVYAWRKYGEHHAWNPENIGLLQWATRTNDYGKFKEYSAIIDQQNKKVNDVTTQSLLTYNKLGYGIIKGLE